MNPSDLDELLGKSAPVIEPSPLADRTAITLARTVMRPQPWHLKTKIAAAVIASVAGLSLGVGTAVAVPLISHWWLWSPQDDLTITTAPFAETHPFFAPSGEQVVCTIHIRVLSDGPTANPYTVFRLYEARAFLKNAVLAEYEAKAQTLYADGGDTPQPYELDHATALAGAIESSAQEKGLTGGGVSIQSAGLCLPE